ncbi:hypothetical protein M077_4272 [Bacteroides fragilis str. 2-F-2 |nr:hypothetical protein M077_4272 [Bacteroides fragilis str. 2-F-2 \
MVTKQYINHLPSYSSKTTQIQFIGCPLGKKEEVIHVRSNKIG